jgi:hypothetical protein
LDGDRLAATKSLTGPRTKEGWSAGLNISHQNSDTLKWLYPKDRIECQVILSTFLSFIYFIFFNYRIFLSRINFLSEFFENKIFRQWFQWFYISIWPYFSQQKCSPPLWILPVGLSGQPDGHSAYLRCRCRVMTREYRDE